MNLSCPPPRGLPVVQPLDRPQRVLLISVLLHMLVSFGMAGQIDPARRAGAVRNPIHLAPPSYRGLPRSIARYLGRQGYTIPQAYDRDGQHNAVRGYFDEDAVPDWAVLASRGGYAQILVFWGGSTARVTRLARRADAGYLQTVGGGKVVYSRSLSTVGRQYILDHHRACGGPEPPPIRHDAINDAYAGKASAVYYFDGVRWHELQGAD